MRISKKKNDKVNDIKEKESFTKNPVGEYTSSGTYYFKNKEILNYYINKTIENKLHVKGEYYISMIYKPMIESLKKVGFYKINFYTQWGTPEDFNEYKCWSNKFENILKLKKKKKKINGILLIPAAGKGKRFISEDYKTHKPLLKISGKPMIVQSILTHPKHQTTKVIITKENKSYKILKKSINKYFPKSKIVTLNKSTKGQAITCLEGLKNEDMELPLTIGSCDVGLIYQNKKFFKLFNDKLF